MGKGLNRSLQAYISKLRRPGHLAADQPAGRDSVSSTTTGWLLSACKYPKTPSFAAGRHHFPGGRHRPGAPAAATLSDVDRFLFENFNSLYATGRDDDGGGDRDLHACAAAAAAAAAAADSLDDYLADGCSSPAARETDPRPPDVARASRRFFVSSPGTSNSLLDDLNTRPSATSSASSSASSSSSAATVTQPADATSAAAVPAGGEPVVTFSEDPHGDFRRSMQEMVDARHGDPGEPLDWDFMGELLACYLDLNDRGVHGDILSAFADLAVSARRRRRRSAAVPKSRTRRKPSDRDAHATTTIGRARCATD